MTSIKQFLRAHALLITILILTLTLRVTHLFYRGDFWFDEAFSEHFATLPWADFWHYLFVETNPPLYTIFLRGWNLVAQGNETLLRVPALIFGLFTVALTYGFAKKTSNSRAAFAGTLLLALSGLHIYFSTENRVYSLFFLLTLASFYLFYQLIFAGENTVKKWRQYAVVQFLLLFSHLTALLIPLIQWFYFLLQPEDKEKKQKFIRYHLLIFGVWALWFAPSVVYKLNANTVNGWYFGNTTQNANILDALVGLFLKVRAHDSGFTDQTLFTLAAALLITLLVAVSWQIKNTREQKTRDWLILLTVWALLPAVMGCLLGKPLSKFFMYSLPAWCLLLSCVIGESRKKFYAALILVPLLLPPALNMSFSRIADWRGLLKYVDENSRGQIMVYPFHEELEVKKYYHGQLPVTGVFPFASDTMEERVAKYNWQKLMVSDADLDVWMRAQTNAYPTVYYAQYGLNHTLPLKWFLRAGWQVEFVRPMRGIFNIYLIKLNAPK